MPLQIQSPSPVPSLAGLVVKKGSKIRSRISSRDPHPAVAHLDHGAAVCVGPRGHPDLVALRLPLGDGVRGIEQQVQEHLAEPRLVPLDHRRVAVVLHQAGAVPDLVPGDVDRRIEHPPDGDRTALLLVAAGEDPQVAHDVADPLGPLARLGERLAGLVEHVRRAAARRAPGEARRDGGDLMAGEVDVRHDVGERVVDLVRHPRRQRPHRRHPPGEDELVLHPFAVGEVADEKVVPFENRTGGVRLQHRNDRQLHLERRPVGANPEHLALDLLADSAQIAPQRGPVLGGDERLPAPTDRLLGGHSHQAREGAVDGEHPAVEVDAADPLRGVLQRGAQLAHLLLQARHDHVRSPHRRQRTLHSARRSSLTRCRISVAKKARIVTFLLA